MYFQNGFCPIAFCHLNIDFPNGCLICIQTLEFSFFCDLRYKNHFVLRIFVNGAAYQISNFYEFLDQSNGFILVCSFFILSFFMVIFL